MSLSVTILFTSGSTITITVFTLNTYEYTWNKHGHITWNKHGHITYEISDTN